jgi:conjugative transposon TraJ protein
VFDGFQHTLTIWIARYINVFLWLPVANIFGSIIGKIQENMLKIDIAQVQNYGDTFFSPTDTAYLIFMIIGIVGYFTVPSVANHIVHAGGSNSLLYRITSMTTGSPRAVMNVASSSTNALTNSVGSTSAALSSGKLSAGGNNANGHLFNKLSGK